MICIYFLPFCAMSFHFLSVCCWLNVCVSSQSICWRHKPLYAYNAQSKNEIKKTIPCTIAPKNEIVRNKKQKKCESYTLKTTKHCGKKLKVCEDVGPLRSTQVVRMQPSWMGLCFSKTDPRELPCPFCHMRTEWEFCDPDESPHWPRWQPNLRLPAPGTVRNTLPLFTSCSVVSCYSSLKA